MLNNPKVIKKNFKLLQKMLSNPEKGNNTNCKSIRISNQKVFKDTYGMDVYPVTLASNNPKDKQIGLRNILKKDILISHLWMTQSRM